MYKNGLYPQPALLADNIIKPAHVCLIDSDIATDILQMMLKGDNIVAQLQEKAADLAAGREAGDEDAAAGDEDAEGQGMSSAEAETLAGAASYSHDQYNPGDAVEVMVEVPGAEAAFLIVARGHIRGQAQAVTEECSFYEVSLHEGGARIRA